MFNCGKCGQTSKAGESPTRLPVEVEARQYTNRDSEGNTVDSFGVQIVEEQNRCRKCAGLPDLVKDDSAFVVNMRGAQAAFNHARRCRKQSEDCSMCKQISTFIHGLPLHHLSQALNEPQVEEFSSSLGHIMLDRWERGTVDLTTMSKRQKNDIMANAYLLRKYEEMGGKIGAH